MSHTRRKSTIKPPDTSDSPITYLNHQEAQFHSPFDVLILTSLIFHQDRVLLLRLPSSVPAWKNKFAVPMTRLSRTREEGVGRMLKSRVDAVMTDEMGSVEEVAKRVVREQVGIEGRLLKGSRFAQALNTAVSPEGRGESVWLRLSLPQTISSPPPLLPDNRVCESAFWATESELLDIPEEDIIWGVRDDILTIFDLMRDAKIVEASRWSSGAGMGKVRQVDEVAQTGVEVAV